MSLKSLIEQQILKIDDHKWGNGEIKKWDSDKIDIHIDKTTLRKFEGVHQDIRIRVPINSARPIKIENNKKEEYKDVPSKLKREINKAFQNKQKRNQFIQDLVKILKDFESASNTLQKAKQTLENIAKHFDLEWDKQNIISHIDDYLTRYTEIFTDIDGKQFFITIDKEKIILGDIEGWNNSRENIN